jgi:hypothetical protein
MYQFTLAGLQPTGTNFVELVAAGRALVTFNIPFHKHSTVNGSCFDGSSIKAYLNERTEIKKEWLFENSILLVGQK